MGIKNLLITAVAAVVIAICVLLLFASAPTGRAEIKTTIDDGVETTEVRIDL